jgi:hypothetical protein
MLELSKVFSHYQLDLNSLKNNKNLSCSKNERQKFVAGVDRSRK